ncbi:MAG TPA: PRC-barrel domain-containing protein [Geopsychrobacteraceae bacterium]|nr:PRC-barrel domain-containing protein [Geopsychrobacteraceae bacterium]
MRQLRNLDKLKGYGLKASDGEIGSLRQVYFSDRSWKIRYLIVRTGKWLFGQEVLIVPSVIQHVDDEHKMIEVRLTLEQIKNSPRVEKQLPVSRHYEQEYYDYYGWEPYWTGDPLFDQTPKLPPKQDRDPPKQPEHPHLRSSDEVVGYHIHAQDGEIGQIKDLIVDDQDWTLRYLKIDTGHWLPGKKILVSTPWIQMIDWSELMVRVDLTCHRIETAPEYDPDKPISRDYELSLYKHYGKKIDPDGPE